MKLQVASLGALLRADSSRALSAASEHHRGPSPAPGPWLGTEQGLARVEAGALRSLPSPHRS